ncbi:unnamed protein product [Didymodactylos carnosus]|uniref:RING-CH-type domain-containing protein n=1 Tax=Didymodactylos carnosus TaxID=1234261 RepID=A0A813U206_9BILA|nr:unnamed protein product [Didymodactylos carnosus]CAF1066723.1 unnamed protein product [Didymodactylos carnosus]CAF3603558.1 unnamed protein product [Didymodactylos carnosus]CAF3831654.1 unnamed protein product [Didymodactylos carnosus]
MSELITLTPVIKQQRQVLCRIPILSPSSQIDLSVNNNVLNQNDGDLMYQNTIQENQSMINLETVDVLPNNDKWEDEKKCRICYSSNDLQSLISPCECSEICQHEFNVVRYPKSMIYFLTNPLRASDLRYLINDIILFLFLSAIIGWLSIVSVTKITLSKEFYDSISFILLPVSVIFIYIIWCWVSFRYHFRTFKEWRTHNQCIRVVFKVEHQNKRASKIKKRKTVTSSLIIDNISQPLVSQFQSPQCTLLCMMNNSKDNSNEQIPLTDLETQQSLLQNQFKVKINCGRSLNWFTRCHSVPPLALSQQYQRTPVHLLQ